MGECPSNKDLNDYIEINTVKKDKKGNTIKPHTDQIQKSQDITKHLLGCGGCAARYNAIKAQIEKEEMMTDKEKIAAWGKNERKLMQSSGGFNTIVIPKDKK